MSIKWNAIIESQWTISLFQLHHMKWEKKSKKKTTLHTVRIIKWHRNSNRVNYSSCVSNSWRYKIALMHTYRHTESMALVDELKFSQLLIFDTVESFRSLKHVPRCWRWALLTSNNNIFLRTSRLPRLSSVISHSKSFPFLIYGCCCRCCFKHLWI